VALEDTDKVVYLKLPAEARLTDDELDRIVGGDPLCPVAKIYDILFGDDAVAVSNAVDYVFAPVTSVFHPK
jgi:hypothetical protein